VIDCVLICILPCDMIATNCRIIMMVVGSVTRRVGKIYSRSLSSEPPLDCYCQCIINIYIYIIVYVVVYVCMSRIAIVLWALFARWGKYVYVNGEVINTMYLFVLCCIICVC
jgi:hypothetical protein